jgi:hypothetical protein
MSKIEVDKIDPQSGTALEIGTSGDTVTVPSGVGLTLTNSTLLLPTTINTDKLDPKSGTALEIGSSGDTITIPSGATITNSGTATGFGGGKVLQVITAADSANYAVTSTSYVNSSNGLTVDITPSSATSKIFVQVCIARLFGEGGQNLFLTIYRDASNIGGTEGLAIHGGFDEAIPGSMSILDSPSTTSATTYQVYAKVTGGSSSTYGNANSNSSITVFEIGA